GSVRVADDRAGESIFSSFRRLGHSRPGLTKTFSMIPLVGWSGKCSVAEEAWAESQKTRKAAPMTLVLAVASLIDGTGVPPRKRAQVVIENDTIDAVGVAGQRRSSTKETVDLTGFTLLPGLIDAH